MITNRDLPNNVEELLEIYKIVGDILRRTGDVRLIRFSDFWKSNLPEWKARFAAEAHNSNAKRQAIRGLKEGLRDLRLLLPSLAPDKGDTLYCEIEPLLCRTRPQ
ncbi:MAG: hypothetical protein LBF61_08065 [Azoarcus sp.]|jgi:hypothetical protein|nr:hypothetical protein [Azoarcus sp.]